MQISCQYIRLSFLKMLHILFTFWALILGLVTGLIAAFAINSYRFQDLLNEAKATFYAYAAYGIAVAAFSLVSGGFNVPAVYIFTALVVAGICSFLEGPSGQPIISTQVIGTFPEEVLWLGRLLVILSKGKNSINGTVDSL